MLENAAAISLDGQCMTPASLQTANKGNVSMTNPKQTLLHEWHCRQGARMAVFGGYRMPLWYSSATREHLAVITRAGLFDTSHMAAVSVTGPGAFDLLQHCFTNDLNTCVGSRRRPLSPGRCVYGAFLNADGGVIDDAIVYMFSPTSFLCVVNAGMGCAVHHHLRAHAGTYPVTLGDLTDRIAKIDIQGPAAAPILAAALERPAAVFDHLPYFAFKGHFNPAAQPITRVRLRGGVALMLSRTGYTGEIGFELFLQPARLQQVWQALIDAGSPLGLIPCGLAARDSLRTGAVLPLAHQDIGFWPFVHHPWHAALPFAPEGRGFTKHFVGAEALAAATDSACTYPFVGFDPRKIAPGKASAVLDRTAKPIGRVLTCVTDMAIGRSGDKIYSIVSSDRPPGFRPKGLSCGFVYVDGERPYGDPVTLTDGRRRLRAEIVRDIRPARTARAPLQQILSQAASANPQVQKTGGTS
jgi:aminomethyltransferase